jgi:pSer/pThr/pTyr-binding forkhead associated (FHA) protein
MAGLLLKRDAWAAGGSSAIEPVGQKWFPLDKTETVIGRVSSADIVLPATYVSRTEAKIVREGGAYVLENITSRNATVFNGRPIRCSERQLLRDGDEIRVGDYLLVFLDRDGDAPGSPQPTPSQ